MHPYLVGFALLLLVPSQVLARVVKWEGKPISVFISTERITRLEFSEQIRSVFLSRTDVSIERENRSLYLRALVPETEDVLFAVGESRTAYQINLSTSDQPDDNVLVSSTPQTLELQAEKARQVPALNLMRSMMMSRAVDGYEIIRADYQEVYKDAFFSMKLAKVYRSPVLHGYVLEVENLASFPVLLRLQEIDFDGMIAISTDSEYLQPKPSKASEVVREGFRTNLYVVATAAVGQY